MSDFGPADLDGLALDHFNHALRGVPPERRLEAYGALGRACFGELGVGRQARS